MNEPIQSQSLNEPPATTSTPQEETSAARPSPGPQDSSTTAPSSSVSYVSADTKIGEVKGDAYTATEQTFYQYEYKYERQERPRLSAGHFEALDGGRLEREGENLFWSASEQDMLASALERRRLLLLCGAPELGKGSVARLLASTLCARHALNGLLYCRQIPTRDMEVPFQEIFGGSTVYHKKVIVLKDALVQDNLDVRRFLTRLDEFQLKCRVEELRSSGSFLIITTDSERLGGMEAKLDGLGILQPLSGPPPDALLEMLHRLVASLRLAEGSTRDQLHELLRKEGARIAKELGTLPRVARFVRESLPSILAGRITLEHALRRAYDLESWLLRDLPDDFDAWSYALALVLCHAAPLGEDITWMHFDRFRRLFVRYLRQELRHLGDKRAAAELCREEDLLRLARAEIQRPGYPQAATVAFSSSTYPAQLWKVLLGPGRHLLSLSIPFLESLMASPEFYLRSIAARALGRIGELDPPGVTFRSLQYSEGTEERRARHIGQVVQGVLGSDDRQYKQACLRQLRRKLRSGQDVRVALTSLRDVGELDLSVALQEMRAAADHWLNPRVGEGKKPDQRQTLKGRLRALEDLAKVDSRMSSVLRVAEDGHLRGIMEEIFSKVGDEVMGALQYSLVGLCLGRHPISLVLSELRCWAEEDGSESGQFLMLLFLSPHGVFDVLDRIPMPAPSSESEGGTARGECGVVLYDLAYIGGSAIPQVQGFLEALHARLVGLSGPLRTGLRKRWLDILKRWARQACEAEACRPVVRSLLGALVRSQAPEVRRDVLSMLQADSEFSSPGSNMQSLAIEAITGSFT